MKGVGKGFKCFHVSNKIMKTPDSDHHFLPKSPKSYIYTVQFIVLYRDGIRNCPRIDVLLGRYLVNLHF